MPVLGEDLKQLIKDSVDVEALLKSLGFSIYRATSSEVRAPCRLHGGDNPTAFSIRLDTKKWRCFTKKCEEDSLGNIDNDLFALVMRVTGVSFMDAVQFLSDFSGLSLDVRSMVIEKTDEFRRQKDMSWYIKSMGRIRDRSRALPSLSEELVEKYTVERDDFFIRCGFEPGTLEFFEVGAMTDRFGVRRATIPIRDVQGNLVSLSARREDGDEEPRYLLEYEFQKGKILYNLYRALHSGQDCIIIVEGFKALWAVHEAGFSNVVACMGASITEDQVLALCMSGFRNCLVVFDGDSAGEAGAVSAEKKLGKAFNTVVAHLPDEKSPDSFDKNKLKELLDLYLLSF